MNNMRKILAALLGLVMLVMSMAPIASFAASEEVVIYFTPNSNWKTDNARFAMYTWVTDGNYQWIEMADSNDDGVYEGTLPKDHTNIIFCRLTPSDSHNGWSTTWNQTNDLVYDGKNNHYIMESSAWSKGEGSWTVFYKNTCDHSYDANDICTKCGEEFCLIIAGNVMKDGDVYKDGDNTTLFVSKWDVADENNRMAYDPESDCYIKIYENVAAGEYHFKVVENKSWDTSYGKDGGNVYLLVEEDGSTVVITFKDGTVTCAAGRFEGIERPDGFEDADDSDSSENADSSNEKNEPEVRLNFFQKIWKAITDFFKRIFGGNKK